MQSEFVAPESVNEDLACECLCRFLSAIIAGPYSACWDLATDVGSLDLVLEAMQRLPGEFDESGLCRLIEGLRAPTDALLAQYDEVFGLVVPRECPPYETEYYPTQEIFGRAQQMADIAGFYRAFGIEPSRSSPERPDHLGLELEFLAFLLLKKRLALAALDHDPEAAEQASVCKEAERAFFRDHLAWWVPVFGAGLRRKASGGYLQALADVLAVWVPAECRRLGIQAVLRPARPELIEEPEEQSGCAACPLRI
jgi:TorA maturation chaperone TorD